LRAKALRLAELLTVATESIGAVLLLSIVVINFFQVFFRYVMLEPLGWTEEAMRYSVVWITFLLAGAALFRGEHMIVDMFGDIFPPWLRRLQSILILLSVSAFCLILIVFGWPQALRNLQQLSPSAQIPMIVPYLSVVAGGVLTLVKAICLMIAAPERVTGDRPLS
jgi:TRAP-type C4-dicarboxylate transport system permease small subunit